jgi:hypothetical protein
MRFTHDIDMIYVCVRVRMSNVQRHKMNRNQPNCFAWRQGGTLFPVATKEQYIYPKVSSLQREVYEETEDAIKKAVSRFTKVSFSFQLVYCKYLQI